MAMGICLQELKSLAHKRPVAAPLRQAGDTAPSENATPAVGQSVPRTYEYKIIGDV